MALIQCPICQKNISSSSDECIHCGVKLKTCPECDTVLTDEAEVCGECGYQFNVQSNVTEKEDVQQESTLENDNNSDQGLSSDGEPEQMLLSKLFLEWKDRNKYIKFQDNIFIKLLKKANTAALVVGVISMLFFTIGFFPGPKLLWQILIVGIFLIGLLFSGSVSFISSFMPIFAEKSFLKHVKANGTNLSDVFAEDEKHLERHYYNFNNNENVANSIAFAQIADYYDRNKNAQTIRIIGKIINRGISVGAMCFLLVAVIASFVFSPIIVAEIPMLESNQHIIFIACLIASAIIQTVIRVINFFANQFINISYAKKRAKWYKANDTAIYNVIEKFDIVERTDVVNVEDI